MIRHRALMLLVAAIAALATAIVPASAAAATAPAATVKSASSQAKSLVAATKKLKKTPRRAVLITLATQIRKTQAKQPCVAITTIKKYRGLLRKLPKSIRKRALAADAGALALRQRLLFSAKAKKCGGGKAPSTAPEPTPTVTRNDATGVTLSVNLPDVQVSSVDKGGKLWTQLGAPSAAITGAPGTPAVPVATFSLAVPDGATVETNASAGDTYSLSDVDLVPAQPDPLDRAGSFPDFTKPPYVDGAFVKPGPTYKTVFPAKAADTVVVGSARGLEIATLQVPLATYDGKKRTLQVRRTVNVNVDFKGGGAFGGIGGAWDRFGLATANGVLNGAEIAKQYRDKFKLPGACGEEFLIITNTATRADADTLAAARNAAGIKTAVFETVAGQAGTTKEQIRDFIRGRITAANSCVKPSYLLLLGGDELIPTFEITDPADDTATSDLPYATIDDTDTLPDIASGRIPGDAAQVATAITKIVNYETHDFPADAAKRALVAAEFEDDDLDGKEDRTFVQFAEKLAKGIENRGSTVTRAYVEKFNGTPAKYYDGTILPSTLLKPGFVWDGDAAKISTAWNAGVFLAVHRDHGAADGWWQPNFTAANVNALTNTALPVVLSINCSSAAYDRAAASFVTSALGNATGAIAVFGDTEDSPTVHNSEQGYGFADALLPTLLPSEGPTEPQRLGDALVHGKLRLNSVYPAATDHKTRFEHRIWHLFGDPTMYMQGGEPPKTIDLSRFKTQFVRETYKPGPPPEEVNPRYAVVAEGLQSYEGQTVALRKGGEVVGQGLVANGAVTIPAIFGSGVVAPGELSVVLDGPSDGPPKVMPVASDTAATELTQTCPATAPYREPNSNTRHAFVVSGQLLGAPEGSTVTATFTPPADSRIAPFTRTGTIDATGKFTATYQAGEQDPIGLGTWSVQSSYAGDAAHSASTTPPCTFDVRQPPKD